MIAADHPGPPTDVAIATTALGVILAECARCPIGIETGGLLLGRPLGSTLTITRAGEPGPRAEHGPGRFRRDLQHAQRLAEQAWEHDRSQWVGEWHTHPHDDPTPSRIDLGTYTGFLADLELGFDQVLALIVAPPWASTSSVHAWLVRPGELRRTPLQVVDDEETA